MRKFRNEHGFTLVGVLSLIMVFLIFLTSLFGSARFRHQIALQKLQKEEAKYAANTAAELIAREILNGNQRLMEMELERSNVQLVFEADETEDGAVWPVVVWTEHRNHRIVVCAEGISGRVSQQAKIVLKKADSGQLVFTASDVLTLTDSNSSYKATATESNSIWTIVREDE